MYKNNTAFILKFEVALELKNLILESGAFPCNINVT